jgi:hypothetical protein
VKRCGVPCINSHLRRHTDDSKNKKAGAVVGEEEPIKPNKPKNEHLLPPNVSAHRFIDVPRRISVHRKIDPSKNSTNAATPASSSTTLDLGRLIARPRHSRPRIIRDTHGQVMFIQHYYRSSVLPILNASALLDASHYCKHSANASQTKSGLEAAKRLLRGKQDWITLVRKLVFRQQQQQQQSIDHARNNVTISAAYNLSQVLDERRLRRRRIPESYFVLTGHGIPHQLLQDHIDLASRLLLDKSLQLHGGDTGSSSSNSNKSQPLPYTSSIQLCSSHNRSSSSGSDLPFSIHWMRLRQPKRRSNTTSYFVPVPDTCQEALQLYLTVMNRLVNTLGVVLPQHNAVLPLSVDSQTDAPASDLHNIRRPNAWKAYFSHAFLEEDSAGSNNNGFDSKISAEKTSQPVVLVQWSGATCRLIVQGMPLQEQELVEAKSLQSSLRRKRKTLQQEPPIRLLFEAVF